MAVRYIELRKSAARGTDSMAADIMRHLHTRQHLGRATVLCDQPAIMLSTARKQWLKLSRSLQKQRSSTLNADKILKYTQTITRMQHMQFCDKSPLDKPDADIYFLQPATTLDLPARCWSTYLTTGMPITVARALLPQLPAESLVVDYVHDLPWSALDMQSKKLLEAHVTDEWHKIQQFLSQHQIHINQLTYREDNIEAMDDALDTLLAWHRPFLDAASSFQHALAMARPLRLNKDIRQEYDSIALLAHRVQALLPGTFSQRFLETYNEDDTFFLYDRHRLQLLVSGESLREALDRHIRAGRGNIARALAAMS